MHCKCCSSKAEFCTIVPLNLDFYNGLYFCEKAPLDHLKRVLGVRVRRPASGKNGAIHESYTPTFHDQITFMALTCNELDPQPCTCLINIKGQLGRSTARLLPTHLAIRLRLLNLLGYSNWPVRIISCVNL